MKSRRAAFWTLFAATVIVYAVMMMWSLPIIATQAGGLTPFDLRPAGYGLTEAQAFLAALPADGVAFYLGIQQMLDTAYPALLGATLFFAIAGLAPERLGVWRWVLAAFAVPGAVFDWLENASVVAMLKAGPDGVTPEMVAAANRWTVLKSAFTTLAMAIVVVLLVRWFIDRRRRHAAGEVSST
ncbi:MAG: hypothetical protein KDJ86_16570 [Bauldia sp.]|uniref:hypothetical protein n=1 Tax=Bauldia sp. TaxID=2575872 RepID=UPI001E00E65A|nr:hypothetical protein [Bauldia sp.]MCB1497396.1 hypothetical protein [Bauldia sp.]